MAEETAAPKTGRVKWLIAAGVVAAIAAGSWWWITRGREVTDDAQIDRHVTQIGARVGGTVKAVHVRDNERVEAGAVLVEIDPRDYQVALERARAELANAQADLAAARANVPIRITRDRKDGRWCSPSDKKLTTNTIQSSGVTSMARPRNQLQNRMSAFHRPWGASINAASASAAKASMPPEKQRWKGRSGR